LPEFRRTALDGSKVLTSELRGKVVVVEFFAEYCVPCRTALPAAAAAQKERPLAFFLGVSEDDNADTAQRMATHHGVTFKVVHDQGRVLAGRMRVSDLPVTVIADASGTVRWVGTTASTKEELVRVIDHVTTAPNH
jgi:thiol-disulfide isomerase/thioredoxin